MSANKEKLLELTAKMTDAQVRSAFVELITKDGSISGEDAERVVSKLTVNTTPTPGINPQG